MFCHDTRTIRIIKKPNKCRRINEYTGFVTKIRQLINSQVLSMPLWHTLYPPCVCALISPEIHWEQPTALVRQHLPLCIVKEIKSEHNIQMPAQQWEAATLTRPLVQGTSGCICLTTSSKNAGGRWQNRTPHFFFFYLLCKINYRKNIFFISSLEKQNCRMA